LRLEASRVFQAVFALMHRLDRACRADVHMTIHDDGLEAAHTGSGGSALLGIYHLSLFSSQLLASSVLPRVRFVIRAMGVEMRIIRDSKVKGQVDGDTGWLRFF
jgi:hypothetical protein